MRQTKEKELMRFEVEKKCTGARNTETISANRNWKNKGEKMTSYAFVYGKD